MNPEIRQFLTPPQLEKHYRVLRFLAEHPNEEFTLTQLDLRLPHGASLARFPEEWREWMAAGECGNKNIELFYTDPEEEQPELEGEATLVCRRPEIRSLEELATLLEAPSTQVNKDTCIGLHTDQIILNPDLLRAAQRCGLAYYFPDKDEQRRGIHSSRPVAVAATSTTTVVEELESNAPNAMRSADLHSGGVPMHFVSLPEGVMLRCRLFTRRGVILNDKHGFPSEWAVGERLLLTFDNRAQVEAARAAVAPLRVHCQCGGSARVGDTTVARDDEVSAAQPGYRIRQRVVSPPLHASPGAPVFTRVLLDIEPLQRGRFKLMLAVGEKAAEWVVDIDIVGEPDETPGVLLRRESHPLFLDTSRDLQFSDPLLAGANDAPNGGVAGRLHGVLPWWQSPSPLVALVRDVAYPHRPSVLQDATTRVFSTLSLDHEANMRRVRQRHAQQLELERDAREAEGLMRGGRHRKRSRTFQPELCNTHMIFYGIDMSLPYIPPPS